MEGVRLIKDKECSIRTLSHSVQVSSGQCSLRENFIQGIRMPFCCISVRELQTFLMRNIFCFYGLCCPLLLCFKNLGSLHA